MVRNVAPTKNQGPSVTPRPKPEEDRAASARLRNRVRATPQAAPAPTPAQSAYGPSGSQAQALANPRTQQFLQNYSRPTGSNFGGDFDDVPVPPVPKEPRRPSDIGWEDSAYNSQIAALERALRDFETGTTTRGERYGQDFTTGLSRLGYQPASDFQAMPNIVEALNQPQAMARGMSEGAPGVAVAPVAGGRFDIEGQMDRTSAAARGTRGMRDEFAGRGTLRSSDFAKGFGDFQNRLGQQLQAMETGRGRFAEDLATELSQFRARTGEQKAAAEESARSRAIMRSIQEMGF